MDDGDWDYQEFEEHDYESEAWDLAQNSSINVLSNKELLDYRVNQNTNSVIGAVFYSVDNEVYSFDVVVDEKYQRQGIGTELTDSALQYYEEIRDAYPDLKIEVETVNPGMEKILLNKGFEVVQKTPIGVNMAPKQASKGYFAKSYIFQSGKPPVKYKKEVSHMSETERLERILSMLDSRFKLRRKPHSLSRLEKILSEEDFAKCVIPDMLDKVVSALEKKQRIFEKIKRNKSKRRPSRKRGR